MMRYAETGKRRHAHKKHERSFNLPHFKLYATYLDHYLLMPYLLIPCIIFVLLQDYKCKILHHQHRDLFL